MEKTEQKIARKHGVSPRTIHNDVKWAESVDAVGEKIGPEAADKIMSEELKPTDADLHAIANLDNPTMADLEANVHGKTQMPHATTQQQVTPALRRKRVPDGPAGDSG